MDSYFAKDFLVFAGFGLGLWLSLWATAIYYSGATYVVAKQKRKPRMSVLNRYFNPRDVSK